MFANIESPGIPRLFRSSSTSQPWKRPKIARSTIKLDPPVNTNKGGYIALGVSKQLDELHKLSEDASSWMLQMQLEEQKETSIPSLKIGFNKIFGYYLEVTKTHIGKVPKHYIRKQTLANSERYFTEELKKYEEKILTSIKAKDKNANHV